MWHIDGSYPSAITLRWAKWGTAYEGATACRLSRVHVPSRRLVIEAEGWISPAGSPLLGEFATDSVCEIYTHISRHDKIVGMTIVPLSRRRVAAPPTIPCGGGGHRVSRSRREPCQWPLKPWSPPNPCPPAAAR